MTEKKQRENLSVRHEGRSLRLTKAHKRKTGEKGEGKGALSNNLVYTKRQKDIYAIRKHETTDQITYRFLFGQTWIILSKAA